MKLAKALKEKTMDVRLVDRLLGEGKISKSEFDQYISTIEDSEGSYEMISSSRNSSKEATE